ncbi:hypothetical protein [Erwinia sp. OPT-41]|uniref:Uncharacterized protein n=1 Tax=Erwinia plantamica TaxID=3237104 RepID=A0ABW7CRJ1_9GAMM
MNGADYRDTYKRSLEAEVRFTLAAAYSNGIGQLLKQEWMRATAERLRLLTDRLQSDGFWRHRGSGTLAQLAGQIKEDPRHGCWAGRTEPSRLPLKVSSASRNLLAVVWMG